MRSRKKINLDLEIPTETYGDDPVKVYLGYERYASTKEKNKIFEDTLKFTNISKGRSSVKFHFKGIDGTEYEMFVSDFKDLALSHPIREITGNLAFVKRGSNYGITKIID